MVFAAGFALIPHSASGQTDASLLDRLGIDRLRVEGFGVAYGSVKPTRAVPTRAYSFHADYGEIARNWRVIFTATYWGTHLKDSVVNTFVDTLRKAIIDPSGDDTIKFGRINLSDIAFVADLRYSPVHRMGIRPYIGGGFGAHVINAEGKAIAGTFVESALDNITAGIAAVAGLDVVGFSHLSMGIQFRYDLLSGARYSSARVVATYLFDRPSKPSTPSGSRR